MFAAEIIEQPRCGGGWLWWLFMCLWLSWSRTCSLTFNMPLASLCAGPNILPSKQTEIFFIVFFLCEGKNHTSKKLPSTIMVKIGKLDCLSKMSKANGNIDRYILFYNYRYIKIIGWFLLLGETHFWYFWSLFLFWQQMNAIKPGKY